jgi:hypothetical protein
VGWQWDFIDKFLCCHLYFYNQLRLRRTLVRPVILLSIFKSEFDDPVLEKRNINLGY